MYVSVNVCEGIYTHRDTHIYAYPYLEGYPYIEDSLHRGTLVKGYPYKCLCVWIPLYMYVSVPYVYIYTGILVYRGRLTLLYSPYA